MQRPYYGSNEIKTAVSLDIFAQTFILALRNFPDTLSHLVSSKLHNPFLHN
ncbi:MAG: hypothetical protein F6K22_14145 [Okeania sp. SIO2F4]|uniref:hypothetical protein n=1 Tax=Okeania sp. SIO2F4 TaxID=2607790 RepID=UPI00142D11B5|nr:hypothetical protein [Okeania sp. SIO2F4]NES03881.1 hypothetical protein [Okeania sp. SIO2F4]